MTKAHKIYYSIGLLIFLILIIYSVKENHNTVEALKDSSFVGGKITLEGQTKGGEIYDVEYHFNNHLIRKDFVIQSDSINVGDSVLLKVSNQYPRDYFVFLKRIKN